MLIELDRDLIFSRSVRMVEFSQVFYNMALQVSKMMKNIFTREQSTKATTFSITIFIVSDSYTTLSPIFSFS